MAAKKYSKKKLAFFKKHIEAKLKKLRASGFNYPNDFEKKYEISHLINKFGNLSKEDLEKKNVDACNAGRIVLKREMGKVVFMTIEDFSGRIQAYFSKNNLEERLEEIKDFDLGDIIGIEGVLFRTKTDELTIEVKDFKLLTKSLNPMPEKHAGLTDIETIYRQRYVDLMSNKDSREVFVKRNKIIQSIRKNLEEAGYLEVETPMMHPIPGGANAKPFKTHHNALDKELFLRIAPELYLKRLLVGGFEKVFEINRNFRNEGLSTIHNPEFTMLEFYEAYGTLKKTTQLVQKLVQDSIKAVNDSLTITYEEKELDLKNNFDVKSLKDLVKDELKVDLDTEEQIFNAAKNSGIKIKKDWGWG